LFNRSKRTDYGPKTPDSAFPEAGKGLPVVFFLTKMGKNRHISSSITRKNREKTVTLKAKNEIYEDENVLFTVAFYELSDP